MEGPFRFNRGDSPAFYRLNEETLARSQSRAEFFDRLSVNIVISQFPSGLFPHVFVRVQTEQSEKCFCFKSILVSMYTVWELCREREFSGGGEFQVEQMLFSETNSANWFGSLRHHSFIHTPMDISLLVIVIWYLHVQHRFDLSYHAWLLCSLLQIYRDPVTKLSDISRQRGKPCNNYCHLTTEYLHPRM